MIAKKAKRVCPFRFFVRQALKTASGITIAMQAFHFSAKIRNYLFQLKRPSEH